MQLQQLDIKSVNMATAKSRLNELKQKGTIKRLEYDVVNRFGPPHAPSFVCKVVVDDREYVGDVKRQKKDAEKSAAQRAVDDIDAKNDTTKNDASASRHEVYLDSRVTVGGGGDDESHAAVAAAAAAATAATKKKDQKRKVGGIDHPSIIKVANWVADVVGSRRSQLTFAELIENAARATNASLVAHVLPSKTSDITYCLLSLENAIACHGEGTNGAIAHEAAARSLWTILHAASCKQ